LAEDLQRALQSLALNGIKRGRRGSKEVILDEGGVRVEVEDTTAQDTGGNRWDADVEERLESGEMGAWEMPNQSRGGSALGTPSGKMRMMPTARPPM
jgi:calcipressin-2